MNILQITSLRGLQREVARKCRQVGFWATVGHAIRALFTHTRRNLVAPWKPDPFDSTYGTNTSGIIGVGSLDVPEDQLEHSMQYGPICEDEFVPTFTGFKIPCDGFTFVDFGSGKGRALLLASLFPFKKIIGVELSQMLHDAAVKNIAIFRDTRQQCHDITAICANAATFEMPAEPLLLFLCNPFDDQVMKVVVSNLAESLKNHPRKVYVWYVRPDYRGPLDEAHFLHLIAQTGRSLLYENNPA